MQEIWLLLNAYFKNIKNALLNTPNDIKSNPSILRVYEQYHLSLLQKLVLEFPEYKFEWIYEIFDKYEKESNQEQESLFRIIGKLWEQNVVIFWSKVFLQDPNSYEYKYLWADLDWFTNEIEFHSTEDWEHWVIVA